MKLNGETRLIGLFGHPVGHSKSPEIFNNLMDEYGLNYIYMAFNAKKGDATKVADMIKFCRMPGANITMPLKTEMISEIDELSEDAEIINAVNTVVNREGILYGYNTDVNGIEFAINSLGERISGNSFCVLGGGGAARATICALAKNGAYEIDVFIRSERAELSSCIMNLNKKLATKIRLFNFSDTATMVKKLNVATTLINATDVGMGKKSGISPVSRSVLEKSNFYKSSLLDLIYAEEETELIKIARKMGCRRVENGLPVLKGQATKGFQLITG